MLANLLHHRPTGRTGVPLPHGRFVVAAADRSLGLELARNSRDGRCTM